MNEHAEQYGKMLAAEVKRSLYVLPYVQFRLVAPAMFTASKPEHAKHVPILDYIYESYQRDVVRAYVREMLH